jgi:diamine N-acetyltransferase
MVSLRQITNENFWDVISLQVGKDQNFVTSNAISIAQSKVDPSLIPLAIYHEQTLVGFLLYGIDPDDGNYWIVRLMVDEKFQKNGYGTSAMQTIIEEIKKDGSHHKILISTNPKNSVGLNLYKKLGFISIGKVIDGEEVLELLY